MSRKYIIFGGTGFVGRYLAEALLKKGEEILLCDIVPPDEKLKSVLGGDVCLNKRYLNVDITDADALAKVPFGEDDIVIHLAARQYHLAVPKTNRNEFFFDVNYKGTENVLAAMKQAGCHCLIYFSTDMTYGKPHFLPVTVDHPQNPFGPYGGSKKASEDLCRKYRVEGFAITIFRPRMILGPGRLGILKKLFKLMELGLPVPLIGDGSNCYQMISVFDCVSAILCAIDNGIPNAEYNLGSDNPPTVYELLSDVIKKVHSKSVLLRTPGKMVKGCLSFAGSLGIDILYKEQYEIADENYIVDIQKTKNELEWVPKYSDVDMLAQAYDYYQEEKAAR